MVNLSRLRRRNQQQQAPRIIDKPDRERHYLSIIGSVLSCILLIVCLCLKEWANGNDGNCAIVFGLTQVTYNDGHTSHALSMTDYYNTSQQILVSCILSVSVLILVSSIVGTVISAGYPREKMEFLRHFAVFNIVSLLCIVLVAGLWLAVVETLPTTNGCKISTKVDIQFGYAYYILLVSGLFSLGGASFNLLFARSAADRRRALRNRIRQEQLNARQLTNRSAVAALSRRSRRTGPPPLYNLVESSATDVSDTEGEAETSMSEPEYTEAEPESPPPAYIP